MKNFEVIFLPYNVKAVVQEGESLIRCAMDAGVHINASCGGEGVCMKCRVIIEKGEVDGGLHERLSKDDIEKGYRMACLSKIKTDLIVRIPVESALDASVLNQTSQSRVKAKISEMDMSELKERDLFIPPVEKRYLELPPPTHDDNISDVSRMVRGLRETFQEKNLEVELPVIQALSQEMRENDYKITTTLLRTIHNEHRSRVVQVQAGKWDNRNFGIAVDIGTTTVYVQLIDLSSGEVLASFGDFNGQISYGEDVISRIMFAEKGDGLQRLHDVIIATINKLIQKAMRKTGIGHDEISTITMAGNTTMTQLLLSIPPNYIRRAPYVPTSALYPAFKAKDIGIELAKHVTALVYPCVSSYVGGDIVSGVMGSGMYRSDKLTLYIDIGTNAEIVIGNKDWMTCAACSAGPAFEGGGIEHGMRATKGAIEDFSIDPNTYEPMNLTIGNVRPKGICGSGLIIAVAKLLETGLIDQQGKYNRNLNTPRIRQRNDIFEYVLVWKDSTQIDRDISLSEIDIENLIRAKGAMYAGYTTLLGEVGLTMDNIERIFLAGGFGSYVDLDKAITIGLLPEVETSKVTYVGNGSLLGCKMSALTNRLRKDVVDVVSMMTNFELSETASYMNNYIASLFLPHTDLNYFPKVRDKIRKNLKTGF